MGSIINTFLNNTVTVTSGCIHHRSKRAECHQCIDYCEQNALIITEGGMVTILDEACTRCGGCLFACPVMAIKGRLPERRVAQDTLYQDSESIPSLKELLIYYKAGCRNIALEKDEFSWECIIKEANNFLTKINKRPFSIIYSSSDANNSCSNNDRGDSHLRRLLGIRAIDHYLKKDLPPENILMSDIFEQYQWFNITVSSQRCSLCSSCLLLCPTAVFRYQDKQLVVDAGKCVGCLLCQTSCPEKALSVQTHITERTVTRYAFHATLCPCCKQHYPSLSPNEHLCPACAVRERLHLPTSMEMSSMNFQD